jgi:hypothetical protein
MAIGFSTHEAKDQDVLKIGIPGQDAGFDAVP